MTTPGFTLFDTPIGRCGVPWNGNGLVRVQLPEARESDTRARLARGFPEAREGAPPAAVHAAVDFIVALLRGESPTWRRCRSTWRASAVPSPRVRGRPDDPARRDAHLRRGRDTTRQPGSARAVGQALGRNPFPIVVPCHRVLAAGGRRAASRHRAGSRPSCGCWPWKRPTRGRGRLFDGDGRSGSIRSTRSSICGRQSDAGAAHRQDRSFPMRLNHTSSLFLALAEAIVYQQLTAKPPGQSSPRVRALFPRAQRSHTRADPACLGREAARRRLVPAKLLALRDLARRPQTVRCRSSPKPRRWTMTRSSSG